MKNLILSSALLIAMILGILWVNSQTDRKVFELSHMCRQIADCTSAEQISPTADEISSKWHSLRGKLFIILHHSDIDNVDYAVNLLTYAVSQNDLAGALTAADILMFYFDDLLDTEALRLTNIF